MRDFIGWAGDLCWFSGECQDGPEGILWDGVEPWDNNIGWI